MVDFICASCDSNLSTTGFANGWRIKIENEAIPSVASAAVTDMWVEPPPSWKVLLLWFRMFKKLDGQTVKHKEWKI